MKKAYKNPEIQSFASITEAIMLPKSAKQIDPNGPSSNYGNFDTSDLFEEDDPDDEKDYIWDKL